MRHRSQSRFPPPLLVAALGIMTFASGCSSCRKASSGGSPSASSSPAPSAATSGPRLPAPTRQGSVIAYAPDGTVLYVADEDASTLHLVPLLFGKDNPSRA